MRDEFSKPTVRTLRDRVASRCSNPKCGKQTTGPHTTETEAINVGVAAHITAASREGPRFNPSLTQEQRKSIANAIWLCPCCAKLIDSDTLKYPVEILQAWRKEAEQKAADEISSTNAISQEGTSAFYDVDELVARFESGSQHLLDWPTRLENGKWIHRPELDQLKALVQSDETELVVLLGPLTTPQSLYQAE